MVTHGHPPTFRHQISTVSQWYLLAGGRAPRVTHGPYLAPGLPGGLGVPHILKGSRMALDPDLEGV